MKGFIYKITSPSTDKIYIGSTILTLEKRMRKHRKTENETNSKIIVALGDAVIECLEEVEYGDDVNILRQREGEYIRQYWDSCVNKTMLGRTYKEYMIEWTATNKEYLKKYKSEKYQQNKDEINAKRREKVVCDLCRGSFRKDSMKKHQQSSYCKSI